MHNKLLFKGSLTLCHVDSTTLTEMKLRSKTLTPFFKTESEAILSRGFQTVYWIDEKPVCLTDRRHSIGFGVSLLSKALILDCASSSSCTRFSIIHQ